MMSHFSGVVMMIWVSSIWLRLREMSPVSSRTTMSYFFSRALRLPTISATSAFIGATYTIFMLEKSNVPSAWRCSPTSCMTVSMATLVLPAPVGAHTSMLSGANIAVSYTRLWMRLSCFMPSKASRDHSGMSPICTSFSSSAKGFGLSAGTCTSSYPFFCVRYEPAGSSQRLLDMRWPPCWKARASSSRMRRPAAAAPSFALLLPPSSSMVVPSRRCRASSRMRRSIAFCRSRAEARVACSALRMAVVSGAPSISVSMRCTSASSWARARRVHHTILRRFLSSSLTSWNLSTSSSSTSLFSMSCSSPCSSVLSTSSASFWERRSSFLTASPNALATSRCSQ
mmetsp:Transcript_18071/g.39512  ORF Transcript_18071/g.39512 Transcript_18071/m.39512 type:complete len:341 (-) Transcript_18071:1047-2069(-)